MHDITDLPAWERLFKKIVWKQLGDMEGKKILDFGSGEGITANHFAEKNDVTAIEPSKEMLSNAWKPHMGLTTWAAAPEGKIVKSDVSIAKNYLSEKEMCSLECIVSA